MSINVRVSRSGPDPFAQFRWTVAAVEWADEVGPLVRAELKAKALVGHGPGAGRLRDSIRYARRTRGGSVAVEFSTGVPYTRFVLDGTAPHMIRARAARFLHWVDAGGHDRFARQVNHPGTHPNPFPRRALLPLMPVLQRRFEEIMSRNLRR